VKLILTGDGWAGNLHRRLRPARAGGVLFLTLYHFFMKQFFIGLLTLLVSTLSCGQVIREAGDTTSLAQDLRAAYSTLNTSRLATGILMDRIPAVWGPHNYDGSAGAATNTYSNWQSSTGNITRPRPTRPDYPRWPACGRPSAAG